MLRMCSLRFMHWCRGVRFFYMTQGFETNTTTETLIQIHLFGR
jgi:hypothetical protein